MRLFIDFKQYMNFLKNNLQGQWVKNVSAITYFITVGFWSISEGYQLLFVF